VEALNFQVLGPVAVQHHGRPLAIGGARQQRILAVLLNDVNHVVPASRFIEAVWRDRPSTVQSQIQIGVSRLRKALGHPGGHRLILTKPSGYLLRLDNEQQLDSKAFQHHVSVGQTLAARGALDEASARLRQALGMWRGPALAGIRDSPLLEAWADALEEARVAAWDTCFRVDLRLGRHLHIIGELIEAAEVNPMHEGIQGSLMQALYLSQRQADALGVYRRTRQRLVEQLGVEPGKLLRRLEYEILSGNAEKWDGWVPGFN